MEMKWGVGKNSSRQVMQRMKEKELLGNGEKQFLSREAM